MAATKKQAHSAKPKKNKPAVATKSTAKPAPKKSVAPPPTKPAHAAKSSPLNFSRSTSTTSLSTHSSDRLPPRLQALIDKSDIADLLTSVARGLDRLDENLLRSAFGPGATIDFGPGVFQGTANDYVHWVLTVLQSAKSTHHMLATQRIEMEGDIALVETYFQAHMRVEKPVGREDLFTGGRYLDRVERRPSGPGGVWKIVHRKQILDWSRTETVSDIFYHQNPDALWAYRSKTDPSYQMAQFPGGQTQTGGKLPAFLGRHYDPKSVKI